MMEHNTQETRSDLGNGQLGKFIDRGGPFSEFESNCYVIKTHNITDFSTRSVWTSNVVRNEVTSLDPRPLLYRALVRKRNFAEDKWKDDSKNVSLWKPYDGKNTPEAQGRGINCSVQQVLTASRSDSPKETKKCLRCPYCDLNLANKGQLNGHMRIHTGEKPFMCQTFGCGKSFARNEELTRHKRTHSGEKPFKCQNCFKEFGRKDHLKKHEKTHLKANEKSVYICTEAGCGNKYTRSDALARHISMVHRTKA